MLKPFFSHFSPPTPAPPPSIHSPPFMPPLSPVSAPLYLPTSQIHSLFFYSLLSPFLSYSPPIFHSACPSTLHPPPPPTSSAHPSSAALPPRKASPWRRHRAVTDALIGSNTYSFISPPPLIAVCAEATHLRMRNGWMGLEVGGGGGQWWWWRWGG